MPFDDSTARRFDDDDAPLALLVVGDTTVQSIALPARGAVVLGRARDCDVTIADGSVSRRHARLYVAPLRLEDLGSANGTRVGARAITQGSTIDLASGDAFTLGSVTVFVQRARSRASGFEVRTDGYFEARLATECARASKFALRFAVVTLASEDASALEAAVRTETRGVDVVSIASGGEVRVLLLHATRAVAEAFVDRVCARGPSGECEVGIAACPDDGVDPGRLLVATRAHARPRVSGRDAQHDAVDPVAVDPVSLALKTRASRLAQSELPVLFVGEDGTGKRTLAAWVHAQSKRARRPLVRVACDTMTEAQLESALFGEGEGEERSGAIEAADGGALLLEHVDALSASLEARLAHVLEYAQTYRVRSTTPRRVRVRVLATARRRIESEMLRRLASVVVEVPPLRTRRADIEPLARLFAAASCAGLGRAPVELTAGALDTLRDHAWPGNARALRIVIDRAIASTEGTLIVASALDLPPASREPSALHDDVETLERERIASALAAHGGNRSRAARALGIARNTLLARIRAYGLGVR